MYKYVVSDFDGTLIDDELSIPVSTIISIDYLRRNGIKFIVVTGRNASFVKYYVKDVDFIDYIVSLNGSYIYDVINEKVIYEKSISKKKIKEIVNKYRKDNEIYLCTDNSRCFLNDKNKKTNEIIIRNLNDFLVNNKVYKIEIHTNKKDIDVVYNELLIDNTIKVNTNTYYNNDHLVEITNKGINKLFGISKIINAQHGKLEEIIAFGDNDNDVDLLSNVGLGICMKNSSKKLKSIIKNKTLSNNEKGFEKSINKIFKINYKK